MRKFISFIVVLMLCSTTFAQLRVASNGNVAINLASTVTPLSPLTIGGAGDSYAKGFFLKDSTTYYIRSKIAGKVYGNWGIPFLGENTVMSGLWHAGVKGASESSTARNYGRAYGVLGCASNATSGYNYGVFGTVGGTNNGAGVVGTVNGNIQVSVPGIYAGYFLGNVVSTGTVTAVSFVTGSDNRLKTNITSLTESAKETGVSSKVLSLIALAERGEEGAQTILGSEFAAGIYLYGLIADGKQIDLKRMVLTE